MDDFPNGFIALIKLAGNSNNLNASVTGNGIYNQTAMVMRDGVATMFNPLKSILIRLPIFFCLLLHREK